MASKTTLCHQSIEDWEDNWLFRRKCPQGSLSTSSFFSTTSTSLTMLTNDPVAMLVPLPNEETEAKALIGEKDIDEVSELSERQSVTSSIDFSSASSTASENDLEHTEYSVLPLRRSSVSISRGSAKEMVKALTANSDGCPEFVSAPASKTSSTLGKTVTFEAVTTGAKPIGTQKLYFSFYSYNSRIEYWSTLKGAAEAVFPKNKSCQLLRGFSYLLANSRSAFLFV
jgi:hypothetical protein